MSEANPTIVPEREPQQSSDRLSGRSLSDHFASGEDRRRHASPQHTRMVNVLKLFLVALAAGLVLTVIAWSNSEDEEGGISLSARTIIGLAVNKQTMKDPKFAGTDSAGRPYVVTADTATQDKDNQKLISLDNLKTDVTVEADHQVKASARQGLFNQQEMTLELFGPVAIFSSHGYELHTAGAFLNLDEGTAYSTEPVEGQGPMGRITADRMRVGEKGASIFFDGHVRLHIKSNKKPAGNKPADN
jgi:lipopolysaccharide export system protein LptC